jgi:hypothetical protein
MARNNHGYEIGGRLGKLEEAQKDTTAKLTKVEEAIGGLTKESHDYQDVCSKRFDQLEDSLEGIRNPKLSLRTLGKLAVKGGTYAGGAGISVAAIWAALQAILRMWTR